jgi:hypothetical protein
VVFDARRYKKCAFAALALWRILALPLGIAVLHAWTGRQIHRREAFASRHGMRLRCAELLHDDLRPALPKRALPHECTGRGAAQKCLNVLEAPHRPRPAAIRPSAPRSMAPA